MVIFLYGEDSYTRLKKMRELIATYQKKHGHLDTREVDFEERDDAWIEVHDFLSQPSMFGDTKLVCVRESTAIEKEGEKIWKKLLKSHLATEGIFILISDREKPKSVFSFLLEKPTRCQHFPKLEGIALDAFVTQEARARKIEFAPDAWHFFLEYAAHQEEPGWCVAHELEKIMLAGFAQPVKKNDVEKIIMWNVPAEVFTLARQFLNTVSVPQRLVFLERLLFQGEAPAYIFNSLAYQAQGTHALALAEYDISVKRGGLTYEEALLDFALGSASRVT